MEKIPSRILKLKKKLPECILLSRKVEENDSTCTIYIFKLNNINNPQLPNTNFVIDSQNYELKINHGFPFHLLTEKLNITSLFNHEIKKFIDDIVEIDAKYKIISKEEIVDCELSTTTFMMSTKKKANYVGKTIYGSKANAYVYRAIQDMYVTEDGDISYKYTITCGALNRKTKITIDFDKNTSSIVIGNSKNNTVVNDNSEFKTEYELMIQKEIVKYYNKMFSTTETQYHSSMMDIIEMSMI